MNRIVLAYCHENADLADKIDHDLVRIGIPFEHLTDLQDDATGAFADRLLSHTEPVILIITDNFLKSKACLAGILPAAQQIVRKKFLVIVADGKKVNEQGGIETVPTHFDRMVYALQYMNYWQNRWLDLSTQQQHAATPAEKAVIEPDLEASRAVANGVGEFISVLKDAGFTSWEDVRSDGYAVFFKAFGLQEWHDPYKNLAAYEVSPLAANGSAAPVAEMQVVTGPLTPISVETHDVKPAPAMQELDHLIESFEQSEPEESGPEPEIHATTPEPETSDAGELPAYGSDDLQQVIRDAWLWLENGHTEQGLELLQIALDQHPDHPELQKAYQTALAHYGQPPEAEKAPPPAETTVAAPASQSAAHHDQEAKSYDMMGDLAAEKGDYLFAKYCWDRAAELDPSFPGIYRKLGIMTSEHLRTDYRETAVHYLQKALEHAPDDAEVMLWMADMSRQNGDVAGADKWYQQAISIDPALRTDLRNDAYLQPAPVQPEPEPVVTQQPVAAPIEIPAPVKITPVAVLTVLITGATSGIGRATAEIFASHGHRLILTGRRSDRLHDVKTEFEKNYHTDVLILPFDVRDQPTVQLTIDSLPENWENIDILINNAGLAKGLSPIQEGELDHWETMIDTNLKGLLYVTRAVAPGMVKRKKGHIINLGSSAGKEVYPNGNVYCATKFAVDALTRAMRLDLHTHNIRVSQVSPGHVEETEFAINRFDGDAERAKIYENFQPLKATDVAEVIYFIATRPAHVNIQDVFLFGTQQASSTVVNRSGR
jgi:NADP-dependent 3-hydroxy acid dehydrogenase YdfG